MILELFLALLVGILAGTFTGLCRHKSEFFRVIWRLHYNFITKFESKNSRFDTSGLNPEYLNNKPILWLQ